MKLAIIMTTEILLTWDQEVESPASLAERLLEAVGVSQVYKRPLLPRAVDQPEPVNGLDHLASRTAPRQPGRRAQDVRTRWRVGAALQFLGHWS
jgi:hypothetical protein